MILFNKLVVSKILQWKIIVISVLAESVYRSEILKHITFSYR